MYKVYANTFTTTAGQDLIATMKTTLGINTMTVRRLKIVHSQAATIKINGGGDIPLYLDNDGKYRFETNLNEVLINSLVVKDVETSIYVLVVY